MGEPNVFTQIRPDRSPERRLLAVLTAFCALVMIGGGVTVGMVSGDHANRPVTLGDVTEAHIVEIRTQRGETVYSGEFRSRVDQLGNTEKDAALLDDAGRRVIGEVELEIPARGREDRRTELEVDIIGLPARKTFLVVIDDRIVGEFTTDDRGSFDMELREGEVASNYLP